MNEKGTHLLTAFLLLLFGHCRSLLPVTISKLSSALFHPPLSLSPKEILSYSFTPSETCGFPLLFVSEAPQSWVQPTFLDSFSLIPPCTAYTSYSAFFTGTSRSWVISHLSEFTWAEASPCSILSPAPGRLLLSLRTRLGYRVWNPPKPERIPPSFVFMDEFMLTSYTEHLLLGFVTTCLATCST